MRLDSYEPYTRRVLAGLAVIFGAALVVVVLGSLPTEAQLRAAYTTPVSTP